MINDCQNDDCDTKLTPHNLEQVTYRGEVRKYCSAQCALDDLHADGGPTNE